MPIHIPTLACFAMLALSASAMAQEKKPLYFNASGNSDKSLSFKVLALALEKAGGAYQLTPSSITYSNSAAQIEAIANGAELDVLWASAAKKASETLLALPFPIDGGLLGWRVFLIDGNRQGEFNKVQTLEDLKGFIALQGKGWADVVTLREAGLTVRTGPRTNLYRMTIGKRGDYFARAVNEALAEQAAEVAKVPELAVEQNLVLQYQAAQVFYIAKDNKELGDVIMRGLEAAWADGSYRDLFFSDSTVKAALEQGRLNERTVIRIDNPNFPKQLQIPSDYWFDPKS